MIKSIWKWTWALAFVVLIPPARAGMLDGLGQKVTGHIADRLGNSSNNAVDKAFDKTDDGINCAAGDTSCKAKAAAAAQPSAAPQGSVKCVATDVLCLQNAKAHGQTVEVVNEEDLDTLRCSSTDASCLQRAKKLGKKVEITD
jgi:hypothetical protein